MRQSGRPVLGFVLSPSERTTLEQYARRPTTAQGIGAACADRAAMREGEHDNTAVATESHDDPDRRQVAKRFVAPRIAGLVDEPRAGAPHDHRCADRTRPRPTLESKPRDATHWSTRDWPNAKG